MKSGKYTLQSKQTLKKNQARQNIDDYPQYSWLFSAWPWENLKVYYTMLEKKTLLEMIFNWAKPVENPVGSIYTLVTTNASDFDITRSMTHGRVNWWKINHAVFCNKTAKLVKNQKYLKIPEIQRLIKVRHKETRWIKKTDRSLFSVAKSPLIFSPTLKMMGVSIMLLIRVNIPDFL